MLKSPPVRSGDAGAHAATGVPRLVRAPVLRAYDRADATTLFGEDGVARTFSGDSAALVREVLRFLVVPRSVEDVRAHVAELSGTPIENTGIVDRTLEVLRGGRFVLDAPVASSHATPPVSATAPAPIRLALALTGGVASMYAPMLVEGLQRGGFEVRVVATANALRFVGALALEALTHARVVTELWPTDPRAPVPHLELAAWAEVVLVCPATASSIARIAQGSCASVVSAMVISSRAPVVLVPSMNPRMYEAPSVQRNLAQIVADGLYVCHPAATGYEVADRPGARAATFGAAPPISAVIDLVSAIATEAKVRRNEPRWDEIYAATALETLPWFCPTVDADLASLLDRLATPPGRFLDLGTGPGTVAIDAARRGYGVVATDISPHALELAQRRAGNLPIAWVVDDVAATRLCGAFDVVHDRGCLHVLPPQRERAYVASVLRLTRRGSLVLLKAHGSAAAEDLGTRRFTSSEVATIFGDDFELLHTAESTLPGPEGRAPPAVLCALRRR